MDPRRRRDLQATLIPRSPRDGVSARTRASSVLASKLLIQRIMPIPKTVVVAVDFGEDSDYALDYGVDLAQAVGASVVVVHAYDVPWSSVPEGPAVASEDMMDRIRASAASGLEAILQRFSGRGVRMSGRLEQDEPSEAIVSASRTVGADLIVMGTHGRRGLPRALLGSVAERVVRTAPCPVLTVRRSVP